MQARPLLTATLLLFIALPARAESTLDAANRALQQGRADEATRLLQAAIAQQPGDAFAFQLLCRVHYAEELADAAIAACERAFALDTASATNCMWLGRAYGLKAENASPLAALSLAKKVRIAFERSVQLDPANVPAQTALGEFYIAAPTLLGGGQDKAARVAAQLQLKAPAAAHRLLAMVAEKRKDFATAEAEFKNAGTAPAALVDLAAFYQRRQQPDKAVATLQAALDTDRTHDASLMDIASILNDAHRSPDLAEHALRLYLASTTKSVAAPAFKVHVMLGRLLAQRGDPAGARREYAAALELASAYAPARTAIETLHAGS